MLPSVQALEVVMEAISVALKLDITKIHSYVDEDTNLNF